MNAQTEARIADELDAGLELDLSNNVVPFVGRPSKLNADSPLEDHADFFRRAAAAYRQRAADAKRDSKEQLAALAREDADAKAAYEAGRAERAERRVILRANAMKRVSELGCLADGAAQNCKVIERQLNA